MQTHDESLVSPLPRGVAGSTAGFFTGLIDYAGLFPPARLPLNVAAAEYGRLSADADEWMLGRFLCPVGSLRDLPSLVDVMGERRPLRLSVIGSPSDQQGFATSLHEDVAIIDAFLEANPRFAVDFVEKRSPLLSARDARSHLGAVADLLESRTHTTTRIFVELSHAAIASETMDSAASICADLRDRSDSALRLGLKIRTGGLTTGEVPPVATVARFILFCDHFSIPFKATAGLHHSVRHYDHEVGCDVHGFLNVFAASIIGRAIDLEEETVTEILHERDPRAFSFTDEGLSWHGLTATVDAIRAARNETAVSFGSCSFDEPREDLQHLGLIPSTANSS